jgi:hypothetical protein
LIASGVGRLKECDLKKLVSVKIFIFILKSRLKKTSLYLDDQKFRSRYAKAMQGTLTGGFIAPL